MIVNSGVCPPSVHYPSIIRPPSVSFPVSVIMLHSRFTSVVTASVKGSTRSCVLSHVTCS